MAYISGIDPTSPGGQDPIAEGDNQIRDFKQAVKESFPNVAGEVTATEVELNALTGDLSDLYPHLVPQGTIIMWSGADADTPSGWSICDGQSVNGVVTPDLRSKFIIASTGDSGGDITGKNAAAPGDDTITSTSVSDHNHNANTGYLKLTAANIPTLAVDVTVEELSQGKGHDKSSGQIAAGTNETNLGESTVSGKASYTNSATSHRHTIGSDGSHSHDTTVNFPRPAYFALAYIMKTSTNPVAA